ncbi:MAG: serine/threonine protein kinase, partial [Krumholzibacteria bacterium]|nr:serine/threonine protein kinase [Candidatus Krumholzibacteria bacterium]
ADAGRFVPGAIVGERYRVVGLLGRGGMGEVYRADDLKLGQPVALKFLPAGLEQDAARLARFLGEVRTARQVTHPNVCRVYDIGEVDGQHYISMEYVDGEDLASLLRRIGRLPQERAVEVARQICAGLAAAHAQGILHRDLKPANVMLDGRGRVRLTDFGLAQLAAEIGRDDVSSGTPAYMAPEQIAGREVTVRSDVYALGLVLYELFTGRTAFAADTVAELRRLHADSVPSSLTSHVQDLDPAVERAVLRCLEKNPADRPTSALAVSAALPGGDPLAAALAAGETPSPELVAQAGEREGMGGGRALLLGLAALVLVVGVTRWTGTQTVLHFLPLDKRPEVMVDRAQDVIATLGFSEPVYADPVDDAWGVLVWSDIIRELAAADSSARRWEGLRDRPDAAAFWYRQSPDVMLPTPSSNPIFERGQVSLVNPPATNSGEIAVMFDLAGNLRRLEAMPKRMSTAAPAEADWAMLFDLAGLDTARFRPDRPRYQRFMAPDLRQAWVGTRAEAPGVELRVEAGAFEGRPVLFNVTTSASLEDLGRDPEPVRPTTGQLLSRSAQPVLILVLVLFAVRMLRGNLGQGRADRRGAVRFAAALFALYFVATALRSHALATRDAPGEIWPVLIGATFMAVVGWGLYGAAEPVGRKVWPTMFVASSRLLSRPRVRWLDPVIGQSVLVGVLAGTTVFALRTPVTWLLRGLADGMPPPPLAAVLDLLNGQRVGLATVLDLAPLIVFAAVHVAALVVVRSLVRRRLPALALTLVVWVLISGSLQANTLWLAVVATALELAVLLRWGALGFVVNKLVQMLCWNARASDWSAWHAEGAVVVLGALVLLVLYGAWAATGGRRAPADPGPL